MVQIIEQLALTESLIQKHTACTTVYLLFFVKNRTEITRWKYGDGMGKSNWKILLLMKKE
jgi:hypothetical protein